MGKIILHIGTPKSGTSALQFFLNANRMNLMEQGFYYPKDNAADSSEITMGNGRKLYEYAQESNFIKAREYLSEILDKYNDETVILSSEGFYFYPKFLYELMPNVKIVVYFREQSERLVSSYGQNIKGNHTFNKTFTEYIETVIDDKQDKMFSEDLLDQWAEYFGENNITVRAYESEQYKGGTIFTDFLHTIGLDTYNNFTFPKKQINISYTRDTLEYKLLLNGLMNNKQIQKNQMIRDILQSYSETHPDKKKISVLSRLQQEKIIEYFKGTNAYIARRYLRKDDEVLFQHIKLINNEQEKYDRISINAIQNITRYIINHKPSLLEYIVNRIMIGLRSDNVKVQRAAYALLPIFSLNKTYRFINNI